MTTENMNMGFTYNGYKYYKEGRYCNKPNCKCHEGNPHGPYWWRRSERTGQRTYIGKNLPGEIIATYEHLASLRTAFELRLNQIREEIYNLEHERNLLLRGIHGNQLQPYDLEKLEEYKYLVLQGRPAQTQDYLIPTL
jgi:hypothetical protein